MAEQAMRDIWSQARSIGTRPANRRAVVEEDPIATVARLSHAAIEFNVRAVQEFGGREGPTRGIALIEQVIGAAFQSYDGQEIHPGDFDKAAMLLRGITGGHPFEDGNKRTGFLVAAYFLEQTGHHLPEDFSIDSMEKLCIDISAGKLREADAIAKELRKIWSANSPFAGVTHHRHG